jgi:hypothetical protein
VVLARVWPEWRTALVIDRTPVALDKDSAATRPGLPPVAAG